MAQIQNGGAKPTVCRISTDQVPNVSEGVYSDRGSGHDILVVILGVW